MRLSHPMAPYQGIAPSDVFFVANDKQVQLGVGYLMMFYQYELYPDAPLHIYLQIDSQPVARSMLLGALLARAEQLRLQTPSLAGRIYAQLDPHDYDMLNFYTRSGFQADDAEELHTFSLPTPPGRSLMGCQLASTPLRDMQEQQQYLLRLNAYRIPPISQDMLTLCMQQEHFMALGLYQKGAPIAEALLSGTGKAATLVMAYVRADMRKQGFCKALLASASELLRAQGVETVATYVYSRNTPQMALMRSLSSVKQKIVTVFPGMKL